MMTSAVKFPSRGACAEGQPMVVPVTVQWMWKALRLPKLYLLAWSLPVRSAGKLLACLGMAAALVGCAHQTIWDTTASEPTQALTQTGDTALGALSARILSASSDGLSALHLLDDGRQALAARLALIDQAERSLDLQYYIWHTDESGQALAAALWRAAARGVRVRLLLDDWGSRPTDRELGMLASHPNIEVRLFNPISLRRPLLLGVLLDFDRGNRRMHNKAMVADNQAAIVGGRNVGDEYFGSSPQLVFSDLDVLAFGPVVRQVSQGFDLYWNSELARRVAHRHGGVDSASAWQPAHSGSQFAATLAAGALQFFHGRATAVYDDPRKLLPGASEGPLLGRQIAGVVGQPQEELWLVSAYFIPGEGGTLQLAELRQRGVRTVVVTNSLAATDVPAVHSSYARYRKPLLAAGVELYEVRPDPAPTAGGQRLTRSGSSRVSLHAKMLVVDRKTLFIGSMNIDPRSVLINTEGGVVFESPELATRLVSGTDRLLAENAYRLALQNNRLVWESGASPASAASGPEPQASAWLRLTTWLLSLLRVEGWL